MFGRIKDFVNRHRRKFIVTGVIVGGTYFAIRYAQQKLIEFQEQKAREFLEKTRRIQHFESTERTCNQIITSMGAEIVTIILRKCSTDELLEQLRQNPPNKVEFWEKIKVIAFTRLTALIYASSILVVVLRVQLNVLGGYLYRDITTEQKQINDDLKEQYLSLIKHYLHEGLPQLIDLISKKVSDSLQGMPLNQRLTLYDMEQLFWSIQMCINSDEMEPNSKMSRYVLPAQLPSELEIYGPLLKKMYNETLDLLESGDSASICSYNVCRGFSLATDAIAEGLGETVALHSTRKAEGDQNDLDEAKATVASKNQTASGADVCHSSASSSARATQNIFGVSNNNNSASFNINNIEVALAKIIPIISGLTSKGFDAKTRPQNLATSLITFYTIAEKCKLFGANVYEAFSSSS